MIVTGKRNKNGTRVHGNATGFRGVEWRNDRKKWRSRILCADGKFRWLGTFATVTEAASAYDEAAREEYGDAAFVNFTLEGEAQTIPSRLWAGICAHGHSLAIYGRANDRGGTDCRECQRLLAKERYHRRTAPNTPVI